MPPIGQDVSALSDDELTDALRELGVDVGPINVATRRTYERHLMKLRTGQTSQASSYEPVDDDEDEDNEVILKRPSPKVEYSPPSQPRQRREVDYSHIPTPRGDSLSRPPLTTARKTTSTTFSPVPRPTQSSSPHQQQQQSSGGGIPSWVTLTAVLVVLVLVYLIYTNMEPNAVSNIPSIPNKVEV